MHRCAQPTPEKPSDERASAGGGVKEGRIELRANQISFRPCAGWPLSPGIAENVLHG